MRDVEKKDRVSLIGMPGCGKTTIGKVLARELNYNFYDMDSFIEELSGKTVKQLFEEGEEYFRNYESEACKILMEKKRAVISTGGGVVKRELNRSVLLENSVVVYINRPTEEILKDVDTVSRPLLKSGKERLYTLYKERAPLYKEASHIEVVNKGYIRDTIDSIEKNLKGKIRE